ncbi:MAG: hypothetical protein LBP56_05270 [Odoribacteraceae bacterium]|jgi:hypothetical protein|nr:hypothetical protein [Odoribacteraceae bacterium]
MVTLLLSSTILFAAYIAAIACKFGVPASISDSYYLLEEKWKHAGLAFTLWCFLVGVTVMACMFDASAGKTYQFLGLFAGGGLGFVGAAPLFKSRERTVHVISAAACALAAILWMGLSGYWIIAFSSLGAGIIAASFSRGKQVFWIESGIFLGVYLTLWITR